MNGERGNPLQSNNNISENEKESARADGGGREKSNLFESFGKIPPPPMVVLMMVGTATMRMSAPKRDNEGTSEGELRE